MDSDWRGLGEVWRIQGHFAHGKHRPAELYQLLGAEASLRVALSPRRGTPSSFLLPSLELSDTTIYEP